MNQNLLVFNPSSLLYLSQSYLYYMVYNIILLFQSKSYWYCYCDSIPGCNTKFRYRTTCAVHMVENHYSISDLDKTKRNLLKLCQYTEMLFEDLKKI